MNSSDLPGFELSRVPTFVDPLRQRPGLRKQNPFRIFALALDRALGDFVGVVCHAASVKARFNHGKLVVYVRNDRPYKMDILDVCPGIDEIIEVNGEEHLSLDALDTAFGPPIPPPAHWREHATAWNQAHLVIAPNMARYECMGALGSTQRFRFSPDQVSAQEQWLRDAGVDPDRWFCVLHYREPSYGARGAQPLRDVAPGIIDTLVDWILETLGGQVVRIGHPEMRPLSERPGYIDLAPGGDVDFKLQLFAISRARFMIAGASGPGICGSAFGTPTAMFNNPTGHGVWNSQDAAMWSHIIAPDGRRISREVAEKREMYTVAALNHLIGLGYKVVLQSAEELKRLTGMMYERTTDTPGWREHWYEPDDRERPNTFAAASDPVHLETCVEFPDLAPGNGTIELAR